MRFSTLQAWLDFLQSLHSKPIQLGLERVTRVLKALHITGFGCPVVTVAGTNGKGSTVRGIEAIFHQAGYHVASFTSPFLFSYNEQIRIAATPVHDDIIMRAFDAITQVDGYQALTPFEFQTIAALFIFHHLKLDLIILEVGLGGRLDAVNAIDPDIAVITSIDLDHMAWLGHTRDAIAYEKAGIMRSKQPAVIGESAIPESLYAVAREKGAMLYRQGIEFSFETHDQGWNWKGDAKSLIGLPRPSLLLQNMSTVLMVVQLLSEQLPVTEAIIRQVLREVTLIGRIQVVPGDVTTIFDVSHNPASVAQLAHYLREHPIAGKTIAVFSMLADKDIADSIKQIASQVDEWWIAPLQDPRAASIDMIGSALFDVGETFQVCDTLFRAYEVARASAGRDDRLVVFGSFHTVKEVGETINNLVTA